MEWMAGKCKAEGAEEDRGAVATVPVGGGGGPRAHGNLGPAGSHFAGICRSFTNSVAAAASLPSACMSQERGGESETDQLCTHSGRSCRKQ
jgi:hypothetical protein